VKHNSLVVISGFAVFSALVSCSGGSGGTLPDLLRSSPFEVEKWSPGGGYYGEPEKISVSLSFSHVPDRASVERHFSITGDGERLNGLFQWKDKTMRFLPASPLETNRDYVISLAADAHDTEWLSLDRPFERRFTTRPDNIRPFLVSVTPPADAVVTDPRAEVRLVFSRTVPATSLRDYVSFHPSMNGSWLLDADGTAAVFTPAEAWAYGKRHEIRISDSFAADNGMTTGSAFSSVFTAGADLEKPRLASAWRLTKGGVSEPLDSGITPENSGREKDGRLRLDFSEPVDALSVKNCLSAEAAPSFRMETMPGPVDEAVFAFESPPVYESRFTFKLKGGVRDIAGNESDDAYVFRIFADGPRSKPPALVGIRLPMAPGSAGDKELARYGIDSLFQNLPVKAPGPLEDQKARYPYSVPAETWIECYFETAPGLSVDVLSVMALFRVETSNNALSFSPRLVKGSGFQAVDPEPGWEQYQRLEIQGYLTNTVNSGVVYIEIGSGLKDTGGNKNEKAFRISLLK
jgi:hypothetical protein